ncbi:MAG: DUF308 domain-containing protein [Alistipes sp.]|nr:DUF308 domain-containing protein [Alistipes sp.]
MRKIFEQRVEHMVTNWWLALIVGILSLVVGFVVLINPVDSYFTFALWLGVAIFVSGIVGLVLSLSSRNRVVRSVWAILAAVIDIFIGILLMFNIVLSAEVMPLLLGIWLLYRGFTLLIGGLDLQRYNIRDAGWIIFGSVAMIVVALIILWLPETLGVEAVVLFIAIAFLVYGASMVSFAFRLADLHNRAKEDA